MLQMDESVWWGSPGDVQFSSFAFQTQRLVRIYVNCSWITIFWSINKIFSLKETNVMWKDLHSRCTKFLKNLDDMKLDPKSESSLESQLTISKELKKTEVRTVIVLICHSVFLFPIFAFRKFTLNY